MIDASIYQLAGRGVRSAAEYENEMLNNDLLRQQKALQMMAMRSGMDERRQKFAEYERGLREQEALRTLLGNPTFDRNAPSARADVYRAAPGLADATIKGWLSQDELTAKATKEKAEAEKARVAAAGQRMQQLGQIWSVVTDQATHDAAIAQTAQMIGPEAAAGIPRAYDPAAVKRIRDQSMTVADQLKQQLEGANKPVAISPSGQPVVNEPYAAAQRAAQAPPQPTADLQKYNEYVKQETAEGRKPLGIFDWERSLRRSGASQVSVSTGQHGFDNESKLRNDFRAEPIVKDYNEMQGAHKAIRASLASASPIGDTAAATKIMKLLDPGSVVRESELAIAMAAAGKLDRLTNYLEMTIKGTKLTPQQRVDFGALADELLEAAGQAYNQKHKEYTEFGRGYNLKTDQLGQPFKSMRKPGKPGAAPSVLDEADAILRGGK